MTLAAVIATTGCSTVPREMPAYGISGTAQLFRGMGPLTHKITTNSPEAQEYFNEGINWIYSFNHDEAVRSFTKVANLDPGCAMAWWGVSYAQGPNYNAAMMNKSRSAAAWDALQKALARIDNTTPKERMLIEALAKRYEDPAPKDRKHLEQASIWRMSGLSTELQHQLGSI